jgi:hypothetical protein
MLANPALFTIYTKTVPKTVHRKRPRTLTPA